MGERRIIQMENICYSYETGGKNILALDDITLSIHAGEFVAIAGPSGSGKSTLMQIMGCMLTPTRGAYYLLGERVSSLNNNQLAGIRNKSVGFVFQNFNLLPRASAQYNVSMPLIYSGIRKLKRKKLVDEALARVGLESRATHYPSELSGGEQQRVAIARAIIGKPSILLADEPTGNLDRQTGKSIMALFQELVCEGMTIIFVTHDQEMLSMSSRSLHIVDAALV